MAAGTAVCPGCGFGDSGAFRPDRNADIWSARGSSGDRLCDFRDQRWLIGLIFAIRSESGVSAEADERRTIWGGFVSFLAVGCPVCNQALVTLVGTSGALAWWAPVQPIVGLLAVGRLLCTLRRRLLTYDIEACPVL